MRIGLSGGDSTFFFARSAKSLYFCTNPLSRSAEAGSDAVSINMRRRSARARQYSERSILGLSRCLWVQRRFLKGCIKSLSLNRRWISGLTLPLGLASILHNEASAAFSIVQGRGTRRDSSNQAFSRLLDEQGRFEGAFDCLRKVLRAAPDPHRCDVEPCAGAAKKKSVRRNDRLLALLSCH
jgi:hypothetical protein